MSRTHRTHLAPSKLAKRGGQSEKPVKALKKTHKQTRTNERAKLRKDYL